MTAAALDMPAAGEPVLVTRGLVKRFGGLTAVDHVDFDVRQHEVHAVIGPNGAGKSTFINLLSGDLAPTSGTVSLMGRDVAGEPAHRISRMGVGRSYQKTNIFHAFTVFENVRLAAQARLPSSMRFLRPATARRDLADAAHGALGAVGLQDRADAVAATLSHGEQRQLEIAMVLATGPRLLLLDEPLAGMGAEESRRMVPLLRGLARGHAVVLVEHDMDAVFAVADRLTVMVNGAVIATGTPAEVRDDPAAQRAYLGHGGADED
jgi:branched-chain amino acid transport system ATP-binding protein